MKEMAKAQETAETPAEMAAEVACMLETLAVLASPRVAEKHGLPFSPAEMLDQIARYLRTFDRMRGAPDTTGHSAALVGEVDAQRLRELCETWSGSVPVSAAIRDAAREMLRLHGVDPPGGWDAFEGSVEGAGEVLQPRGARTVIRLQSGPDPVATALSNAMYMLEELTSSRRAKTLAVLPTQAELLAAVDTYLEWPTTNPEVHSAARALRSQLSTWSPSTDIPMEVAHAARAFLRVLGAIEPPSGWDVYDGFPETWGQGKT